MKRSLIAALALALLLVALAVFASCTVIHAIDNSIDSAASEDPGLTDVATAEPEIIPETTEAEPETLEPTLESSETKTVEFIITPEQESLLADFFGDVVDIIPSGDFAFFLNIGLPAADAEAWNAAAPSDIFDILDYFKKEDGRFHRFWMTLAFIWSDYKSVCIELTPEQDAIINELVDEKYRVYAGYWDIWFMDIMPSSWVEKWNKAAPTTRESILKFLEDHYWFERVERHIPVYSE